MESGAEFLNLYFLLWRNIIVYRRGDWALGWPGKANAVVELSRTLAAKAADRMAAVLHM